MTGQKEWEPNMVLDISVQQQNNGKNAPGPNGLPHNTSFSNPAPKLRMVIQNKPDT